ncbi:hypothetical protein LXL04_028729 [Taraxacum kok-saghyz]
MVHAQELQIKELGTQLESKTHEADHRLRVIDMYKAQNQEMNLKLVKLVEDKDAQVLKLSEKMDGKFEQILKALSEIAVPKVVERTVEKVIEKPMPTSQEGGDKEGADTTQPSKQQRKLLRKSIIINPEEGSSKQKPAETEETPETQIIKTPQDISKDEELAKKLQEEERLRVEALKEKDDRQIQTSETRIWPVWTRAKIMQVALSDPNPYWLHPIASQRVKFDANFQLDMPICPRAFLFIYIEPLAFFNGDDEMMNKILIDFYAKKSRPQQEVWSCIPIKTIPRIRRTNLVGNAFYNWEFEVTRGTEKTKSIFSFAEVPLMNPSDWINLHQIMVLKCEDHLKPHIKVFKLLMQNYMFEMGKYDLVAAELMKRVPVSVKPTYVDYGINSDGLITKDPWGVVVKITENDVVKYGHLIMTDIYTIAPNHLKMLKQKIFAQIRNSEHDKMEAYARIVWHEAVRSKIITFHNFMVEHEEKEE